MSHIVDRDESMDTEIYSTPPSSPQPTMTNHESTQTNTSHETELSQLRIYEQDIKALEKREAELKRKLDTELEEAERRKAESTQERNRRQRAEEERSNLLSRVAELERRLQESQRETEQWRCDYERSTSENQSLQNLIENLQSSLSREQTGSREEVRKDLATAIESISSRGPFINLDSPLSDMENRILHTIRLNSRVNI